MPNQIIPGQNLGVIESPLISSDYVADVNSPIVYKIIVVDGKWLGFESAGEQQIGVYFDTMACVTFSAIKCIVLQLNRAKAAGEIPADILARCQELGYLNAAGLFDFSERFIAKMSGTTTGGNSARAVWDTVRHCGLLGQQDWPYPNTQRTPVFSWDDYYAEIPQELKDKALLALELFDIVYEQLGDVSLPNLEKHLKQAPIQILTYTCPPWNTTDIVLACGIHPSTHATVCGGIEAGYIDDLDSYDPFDKKLALDYQINFAFKGVVSFKTQPKPTTSMKTFIDKTLYQLITPGSVGGFFIMAGGMLRRDDLAKMQATWIEINSVPNPNGIGKTFTSGPVDTCTTDDLAGVPLFDLKGNPATL